MFELLAHEADAAARAVRAGSSTPVLISLGLPHAPSFLRAICSIPLFAIAKFVAIV
jgi:hypothetical protein